MAGSSACQHRYYEGYRIPFRWDVLQLDMLRRTCILADFVCKIVDFALDWKVTKKHDSLYFGVLLLYEPLVRSTVALDQSLV